MAGAVLKQLVSMATLNAEMGKLRNERNILAILLAPEELHRVLEHVTVLLVLRAR